MGVVKMIMASMLVVIAVIIAGVVVFSLKSKAGAASGLANGVLAACPSSPNCVSSEAATPPSHLVAAFSVDAWEKLPSIIEAAGGVVTAHDADYLAATFTTPFMQFVDDVEFRKSDDAVHVRSASRVGHSDFGANAKRVERLRKMLVG